MHRQETTSVWSPDEDDEVFNFDSSGRDWESVNTKDTDEQVGVRLKGERVTFEFHFPGADITADTVLSKLIDSTRFVTGLMQNEQYKLFDSREDSLVSIGCENEDKIVIHTKSNTTPETIKHLYHRLKGLLDTKVRVIKYYQKFD